MKTISVVFTDKFLEDLTGKKAYSFNIDKNVKVNDMLESNGYRDKMQVVRIYEEHYDFYNRGSGELFTEPSGDPDCFRLRTLFVTDKLDTPEAGKIQVRIL